MAQDSGHTGAALEVVRSGLAGRDRDLADADRELADALAAAHATATDAIGRLDTIAAEIDDAVRRQVALAVDTAVGARQFARFLIAKQRETSDVIAAARAEADAKAVVLQRLTERYRAFTG